MTNQPAPQTATLQREYVAGGRRSWAPNAAQALSWSIDDITHDLGDDLYERMALDPQITACLTIFKAAVLEDGIHLGSAVDDEDAEGYTQAAELVTFAERVLQDLDTELDAVLWDLLTAIALGNRVAEEVYAYDSTYSGRQQLVLRKLKVKPRRSTAFVVDPYNNVLGFLVQTAEGGSSVQTGTLAGAVTQHPAFVPRDKFAVVTFRPKDHDPRGTSILRPAYNAWWVKQQIWPEYLKYLAQFGGPSVVGYTAENATSPAGETRTPEQLMLDTLLQWQNGVAATFPYGSKVDVFQPDGGGGTAFERAFALCNHEITKAILTQTLATEEAKFGTRAQGQVHQDVLTTLIRQAKGSLCRTIRRDVLMPMVRFNYGEQAVSLTPEVSLGEVEQQDLPTMMNAIAQLERAGYLADSQRQAIDIMLGLPQRSETPEEEREQRQAARPVQGDDQQPDDTPPSDEDTEDEGDE